MDDSSGLPPNLQVNVSGDVKLTSGGLHTVRTHAKPNSAFVVRCYPCLVWPYRIVPIRIFDDLLRAQGRG